MTHHRALFVSDVHVGARASQGARFRAWLERNRADVTYVIGDLFDGAHALRAPDLVETIKVLARAPGRIVYVPGNHDALFRRLAGVYGRLEICARATHTALNGRRLLVLHGDEFDGSLRYGLPTLGSIVDSYARRIFPARRIEAATQAVNRWATGGAKLGERLGAAAREGEFTPKAIFGAIVDHILGRVKSP